MYAIIWLLCIALFCSRLAGAYWAGVLDERRRRGGLKPTAPAARPTDKPLPGPRPSRKAGR